MLDDLLTILHGALAKLLERLLCRGNGFVHRSEDAMVGAVGAGRLHGGGFADFGQHLRDDVANQGFVDVHDGFLFAYLGAARGAPLPHAWLRL